MRLFEVLDILSQLAWQPHRVGSDQLSNPDPIHYNERIGVLIAASGVRALGDNPPPSNLT